VHLLTISGSLRTGSINSQLLVAVAHLAPPGVTVRIYDGLGELPHFNPDLDVEPAPEPVADLRAAIAWADAILVSSPEYAHGVPGSLKNALDWLVSGVEILDKPVMLLNATPRSTFAQESLAETLRTMSARVVGGEAVAVPIHGRRLRAEQIVADGELAGVVRGAVAQLMAAL
jgi:chromate reductase, NAD(P)H dehydrogenase (quinone)